MFILHILHFLFRILHVIAPYAIILEIAVLGWFLWISRNWSKEDNERYNRK